MDFISLPDYHIHTFLCKHAERDVSDYKRAAQQQKITEICFSDHGPNPDGYDPRNRMEMGQFPSYRQMVTDIQDNTSPEVLFGIETDYYEGCEKFLGEWLPQQGFDFVLGSIHYGVEAAKLISIQHTRQPLATLGRAQVALLPDLLCHVPPALIVESLSTNDSSDLGHGFALPRFRFSIL